MLSGIVQVSDASIEELEGNSVPWGVVEGDELGKYLQDTLVKPINNNSN